MSESEKDILFNEILERYEKEIFNYCFQKLSHDKFMAEEVFDDVFMNLYKKWEHLVIGKDIRAYLYRTADILIKERLRKESRYYRFNYSLEESEEVNPQQQQSTLDTYSQVDIPSTNADDFLESPYMQDFKQGLSPQDRLLYELRIEKHMTLMKVAEKAGLPYSTARLRLLEIEEHIRERIKQIFY